MFYFVVDYLNCKEVKPIKQQFCQLTDCIPMYEKTKQMVSLNENIIEQKNLTHL